MQTTRPMTADARPGTAPAGRSHFLRTSFIVLLGLGALAAAIAIGSGAFLNDSQASGTQAPVGLSSEEKWGVGVGHVDVEDRVINLYPVQPGEVVEIPKTIKENAPVKKGAVLFRMDDFQAKLNVQMALDALEDARLKLAQAEKMPQQHAVMVKQQEAALEAMKHKRAGANELFQKADRLFTSEAKLVSKEDRDAASEAVKAADEGIKVEEEKLNGLKLQEEQLKLDISRAKFDVSAKKTRWEQAKYALEKCELRAPVDGTVLRLQVSVGDVIGPNPREPAILFCPAQKRIIRAEVEQEFASKVSIGQAATIQDDSRQAREWHGKVKQISDWYLPKRSVLPEPRQFNDVRTLECIVELDDETGLKIGQRVRVLFGK